MESDGFPIFVCRVLMFQPFDRPAENLDHSPQWNTGQFSKLLIGITQGFLSVFYSAMVIMTSVFGCNISI